MRKPASQPAGKIVRTEGWKEEEDEEEEPQQVVKSSSSRAGRSEAFDSGFFLVRCSTDSKEKPTCSLISYAYMPAHYTHK